jgi:hypothetical protein
MILKFEDFLNEAEQSLSKTVSDLEQKIWSSKKGPAELEWENISQEFLDGEGRESWSDLDDYELEKARKAAQGVIDKYKIK